MIFYRAVPAVFCMALLGTTFSSIAKADEHDKTTTVTFTMPVEIPAVHLQGWGVLPPGTYVFKLLDSKSDRHIVQIFNQDQTKIYATILAIPNYRLKPTDKTVITFNEGVRGRPEALRAWFYPGANSGEEFVYPKAKAVELAQVTQLPVLAVTTELPVEVAKPEEPEIVAELKQAPIVAVEPTGDEVALDQVIQSTPAEPVAVEPAPEAAPVAENKLPDTVELAQATQSTPTQIPENKLPDTASDLPLIALCGLLTLGGALTIRSIKKRAL